MVALAGGLAFGKLEHLTDFGMSDDFLAGEWIEQAEHGVTHLVGEAVGQLEGDQHVVIPDQWHDAEYCRGLQRGQSGDQRQVSCAYPLCNCVLPRKADT